MGLGTLRAGAGLGGETMDMRAVSGVSRLVRSIVRSLRAAMWLSSRGVRGKLTEGLAMAVVRSCRLARKNEIIGRCKGHGYLRWES